MDLSYGYPNPDGALDTTNYKSSMMLPMLCTFSVTNSWLTATRLYVVPTYGARPIMSGAGAGTPYYVAPEQMKGFFGQMDSNGDGYIAADELPGGAGGGQRR